MNTEEYLSRIKFFGKAKADLNTLNQLHQNHIFHIPFENLDIQSGQKIHLEELKLFNKIIKSKRGGFCYELNYLFLALLLNLGFDAKMISARIFENNEFGPQFDHMAIIVRLGNEEWLADVGFGDLFIKPLKINQKTEQIDGGTTFKISPFSERSYLLSKSENGLEFEKKYVFETNEKQLEEFLPQCELKQQSPDSYFVKNKVCTIAQKNGRKTIFNSKYIEKQNGNKTELLIENKEQEKNILEKKFGMTENNVC
jgi:N-hydroxyarylamine O-acetyltransferase